jgi:hypothetical protein
MKFQGEEHKKAIDKGRKAYWDEVHAGTKKSKVHRKPVIFDGMFFESLADMARYLGKDPHNGALRIGLSKGKYAKKPCHYATEEEIADHDYWFNK